MKPPNSSAPSGLEPPGDVNPRREPVLDFPDRELGEMSPADYEQLGFLGGLEVHQQLDTGSKLFCRCPSGRYVDRYDAEVLRHMRPTLSELGEYDGTALMEFKTRKEIVYRLERGTVCTYEIDDTPPFEINQEAIQIALETCLLLNLNLVSELHVMRKQYLDGSIPTGFQRTAMVGLSGVIPFRVPELGVDRGLGIRQLSLEEDACREVSDVGHRITFWTDRLGMPLTEVVTEPELLNPWEMQAGARLIALTSRHTGKVRRGPGAARQDVNVSVAGGRRIEIKGVDRHRGLPRLVHIEGFRQLNLLRIREELRRRGLQRDMLEIPATGRPGETSPLVIDATSLLHRSPYAPLSGSLALGGSAIALRLPGFAGILTHHTQPGCTFAGEIEDRVRVIACLTARPFLIHSDIEGYGLTHAEWRHLRNALGAGSEDTVVVLWGPGRDVDTAAREVFLRAQDALEGVPAESRQAFPDGTTGFERILPGPNRMYPDTDTPPVPIFDHTVEEIRGRLPETPWERDERYRELGLEPASVSRLLTAPWADLYDELSPTPGECARVLAAALDRCLPRFRRETGSARLPSPRRLRPLVQALQEGRIRRLAAEPALARILREPEQDPETILAAFEPGPEEEEELEIRVRRAVRDAKGLGDKPRETLLRWAMGQVMPGFLGRVDPAEVRTRLQKALEERVSVG